MGDTDFAALIEPVARFFWGDPNPKMSSKTELRWGSQGSRAVFLDGVGNWKDFEGGNDDGTVLGLVMAEMNCDKASAVRWLESQDFIPKRDSGHSAPPQRQQRPAPVDEAEEAPPAPSDDEIEYEVEHDDYPNRDGEFQYRVIRYQYRRADGSIVIDPESGKPKKTFKQKSRDAQGRITFGLNGRSPCLLRWPEVEQAVADGKTIIITEGERAAKAVIALGWESTTNSGGAGNNFTDEMAATFRGANVVILPDNDPQATKKVRTKGEDGEVIETRVLRFHKDGRPVFPGQDHAEGVAAKLRGLAASVKVLALPGLPQKGDIVEWIAAGGTAEQLQTLIDAQPHWRPRPPISKFGAVSSREVAGSEIVYDWMIKGLLERHGVFLIVGEPLAGKSFVAQDLGMKVARGVEYGGRKVKQGLVAYVAVEDGKGTKLRQKGYQQFHGIHPDEDVPFIIMDPSEGGGFTLMSDDSVDALVAELLAWETHVGQKLELVIIDTYSMATEGLDEIDGAGTGKVIARLNRIRDKAQTSVGVVHHMNGSGTRVRGHSSLTANVPNVIEVRPMMTIPRNKNEKPEPLLDGEGREKRRAILTKNKNGLSNVKWTFVLPVVEVGTDADGVPITTCVCARPVDNKTEDAQERQKLSPDQKLVYDALLAALDGAGQDIPHGAAAGPQVKRCAPQAAFVASVRKTMSFKAGEDEVEARNSEIGTFLKRTTTDLINGGYMGRDNDLKIVWWTGKSSDRQRPRRTEPAQPPPGAGVPDDVMNEIRNSPVPF